MKKEMKTIGLCLLLGLGSCTQDELASRPTSQQNPEQTQNNSSDSTATKSGKKIKLAILLDTSGSMSGLIEQAKNQLWKIVNKLAKAKDSDGNDPEIEIALYQYGNDNLSIREGYVQQIHAFTSELDEISEELFALQTNGGSEYCGTVIQKSLEELKWSNNAGDLQMIFIAGNEGFTQGNVAYESACEISNNKNVIVNTIFCGDYQQGINVNWEDGAKKGEGKYMNIDHDAAIVHINSPYDDQITKCNKKLNKTYVPYGKVAAVKKEKQLKEDANASSYGSANFTKRIISKGGKAYKNKSWDMVDAIEDKNFKFQDVQKKDLPEEMKNMTEEEKKQYVLAKKAEREQIKKEIKVLAQQREKHVVAERAKMNLESQLDDAIISSIVEQAKSKHYTFEK